MCGNISFYIIITEDRIQFDAGDISYRVNRTRYSARFLVNIRKNIARYLANIRKYLARYPAKNRIYLARYPVNSRKYFNKSKGLGVGFHTGVRGY